MNSHFWERQVDQQRQAQHRATQQLQQVLREEDAVKGGLRQAQTTIMLSQGQYADGIYDGASGFPTPEAPKSPMQLQNEYASIIGNAPQSIEAPKSPMQLQNQYASVIGNAPQSIEVPQGQRKIPDAPSGWIPTQLLGPYAGAGSTAKVSSVRDLATQIPALAPPQLTLTQWGAAPPLGQE